MAELLKRYWSLSAALLIVTCVMLYAPGCAGIPERTETVRHEVVIKVEPAGIATAAVEPSDRISRTMQIQNQEGTLSTLSFICGDKAYVKIFSGLTVSDVSRLWNDICVLKASTKIRKLIVFINSPGGDAHSGLALADEIERAKKEGFYVTAHASGIVASAAVPVFAVCNYRQAAPGTIFMVHETSIWKWPGQETHSDIRSQNELMDLLRERYLGKLAAHSRLTVEEWGKMENKTTWFNAAKAKAWGLVDEIH